MRRAAHAIARRVHVAVEGLRVEARHAHAVGGARRTEHAGGRREVGALLAGRRKLLPGLVVVRVDGAVDDEAGGAPLALGADKGHGPYDNGRSGRGGRRR